MALRDSGGISAADIANAAAVSANGTLSIDVSADVKQAMLDFLSTANRMVSGSQLGKYFATTETLANRLGDAVKQCGRNFREMDATKAKEVVNTFNALNSRADGADISGYFSEFAGGFDRIQAAVTKAQGMVGKFVEGFHMEDFNRMFGSYDTIQEWMSALGGSQQTVKTLMQSLIELNGTDVSALTNKITGLNQQITELQTENAGLKSGAGFDELDAKITDLTDKLVNANQEITRLRNEAEQEFRDFLTGNNIDPGTWDNENWEPKFQSYFDSIQDGSMTARKAIMLFKEEYGELLRDGQSDNGGLFSTDRVSQFITKLEEIYTKVGEISNYIHNVTGNAPELLTGAVEKDLQNIAKEDQALRHIIDEGGQLGQVGQVVNGVAEATSTGSQKMGEMSDQTIKLVEALSTLGGTGEGSLAAISSIFRNLNSVNELTVSPDEFKKLESALESLGRLQGLEKLTYISGINLQGFNSLSVSKASLRNLADYLPVISHDVDIGKLQALAQINLSNFNQDNLKVSSAAFEHLRELIAQISGQPLQVKSAAGQTQQLSDEQAAIDRLNAAYNSHIDAVKRAVEEEQKKEEVAERLALKLQVEKEAMEGVSSSTKNASDAGAEYAGIWDKMFLGKFEAQLKKVQEQFSALQDKPEKLSRNMALLAEKEQKMREAGTMKEKLVAYKEFVLILDTVRDQIGAVSAEEKNLSTAAKDLLRIMNEVQKPVDALKNGSFANELQKLQIQAKGLSNADLTRNLNDMVAAMEAMKAAIGPNGTPQTEQDLYALARAYDQWKVAVQGVKSALWLVNTENAGMKRQEKEARDFEKTASDLEQRVDSLKKKFAELKTPGKIDSGSLQQIQQLLTTIRDTSADASTRTTAINDLKALIDQLTGSYQNLADTEKADAEAAKLANQERNQSNAAVKQLSSTLTKAQAALEKYKSAQNIPGIKNTYAELQRVTSELQNYQSQISGGAKVTPQMAAAIQDLSARYVQLNQQLAQNNTFFGRWLTGGMGMLRSRLSYTFGLVNVVMKTVAEIKKMISTAVELDSAMNDLQIVTRASGAEMDEYAKRVSAMAKETAQATKDLIDATTVYARLGYNMDESSVLAKYTAMLQAVGDIDASAAQDAMTAIVKAFNVDINDIEQVMDKLVVVGNNFPISVSQLAEGMNNAGSMLAVAGNSFEESVALLMASNATVQNISKASTGLRTIAARIRKMETEDGEIVEESKYDEMIQALTRHNVALVDANGEYRKTYDIIRDIAAVWEDMTSMQKSAVVEALAGTRQQNIFASLMTQFGDAEKAMDRMGTSSGELQEAFDIRMESIQAHVQKLKAAFDELSRDFVDSGLAKGVVDLLTRIVELLDFVVERFWLLTSAVAAFAAVRWLTKVTAGVDALMGLSRAAEMLSGIFTKVFAVVPPQVLAAVSAVFALVKIYGALEKAWDKAHPSFQELKKDADEAKAKTDELSGSIKENAKKIEELEKAKNDGSITQAQLDELARLKDQNEQYERQLNLLERIAKYKTDQATSALNDEIDKFYDSVEATLNSPSSVFGLPSQETTGYVGMINAVEKYARELQEEKKLEEELSEFRLDETKESIAAYDKLSDKLKEQQAVTMSYLPAVQEFWDDLLQQYNTLSDKTDSRSVENYERIGNTLSWIARQTGLQFGDAEETLSEFEQRFQELPDTVQTKLKAFDIDFDEKEMKAFTEWLGKYGYSIEQFSNDFANIILQGTSTRVLDKMFDVAKAKKNLNDIKQKMIELGADPSVTIFGNIDMNKRQVLEWTESVIEAQRKALESWDANPEDMLGDISTVLGGYSTFNAGSGTIDIAFSPILQTEKGPVLLTHDEVHTYIQQLLDEVSKDGKEWTTEDLLTLDAKGATVNGKKIKNIIAEVGDEAEKTAEIMHYMGKDGALQLAAKGVISAERELNKAVSDSTWQFGSFKDEVNEATAALNAYEEAMKGGEKDDAIKKFQEIYQGAMEDFKAGKVDTNRIHNLASLMFSDEQLAAMDYDMAKIGARMRDTLSTALFSPDEKAGKIAAQRMLDYIQQNAKKFEGIANVTRTSNGGYSFMYEDVESLADALGYSSDVVKMLLSQWDTYGIEVMRGRQDVINLAKDYDDLVSKTHDAREAVKQLIDEMRAKGNDNIDIATVLNDLVKDGTIPLTFEEIMQMISGVDQKLTEFGEQEQAPTVDLNDTPFNAKAEAVQSYMNLLNNMRADPVVTLHAKNVPEVNQAAGGKRPGKGGGNTLVNELGPELISDNGKAFIANNGKPGFVNLSDDAIVFTAQETEDILHGRKTVNAKADANGSSGVKGLIQRLFIRKASEDPPASTKATSGTKRCPYCGESVRANASTCPYCSYNFTTGKIGAAISAPTTKRCPHCGESVSVNASICPYCSYNFKTGKIGVSPSTSKPPTQTAPPQDGNPPYVPPADTNTNSSGYGGYSEEEPPEPQKFDWIEVRLNRINRIIENLRKVTDNIFKKLPDRMEASRKGIREMQRELDTLDEAAERYMREADNVGLDASLARRVREGAIDINEYDEETRKLIDEYQQW